MEINLKERAIPMWDSMIGAMVLVPEADLLKQKSLVETYIECKTAHDRYVESVLRHVAPNNWLKLHGYRMRRKVR